jgi:hypothetical protein
MKTMDFNNNWSLSYVRWLFNHLGRFQSKLAFFVPNQAGKCMGMSHMMIDVQAASMIKLERYETGAIDLI